MCFLNQMRPMQQGQNRPFFVPNFSAALQQPRPPTAPTGPQPPAQPGPGYGLGGEFSFFPKQSIWDFKPVAPAPAPKAPGAAALPAGVRRRRDSQGNVWVEDAGPGADRARGGPGTDSLGRGAGQHGVR